MYYDHMLKRTSQFYYLLVMPLYDKLEVVRFNQKDNLEKIKYS
jgi:hypothetical protein